MSKIGCFYTNCVNGEKTGGMKIVLELPQSNNSTKLTLLKGPGAEKEAQRLVGIGEIIYWKCDGMFLLVKESSESVTPPLSSNKRLAYRYASQFIEIALTAGWLDSECEGGEPIEIQDELVKLAEEFAEKSMER